VLKTKIRTTSLDVQRRSHRRAAYLEQCFLQTDTRALWVKSINLSDGGMCVAIQEFGVLKRGSKVTAFLQNFEAIDATVRWTRGNIAGLDFAISAAQHPQINVLLERLIAGDDPWVPISKKTVDEKLPDSLREILRPGELPDAPVVAAPVQETDPTKRRVVKRTAYTEPCRLKTDKRTFQAEAINISEGGMSLRLRGLGILRTGAPLQVVLEGGYPPIDATLRWSKDRDIGVQFHNSIKDHPVLRAAVDKAAV